MKGTIQWTGRQFRPLNFKLTIWSDEMDRQNENKEIEAFFKERKLPKMEPLFGTFFTSTIGIGECSVELPDQGPSFIIEASSKIRSQKLKKVIPYEEDWHQEIKEIEEWTKNFPAKEALKKYLQIWHFKKGDQTQSVKGSDCEVYTIDHSDVHWRVKTSAQKVIIQIKDGKGKMIFRNSCPLHEWHLLFAEAQKKEVEWFIHR